MINIPLFPLNTVLFPGMPLRLHIFEERYKQMIQHCIQEQTPFGVVLIKTGREALGPLPMPHTVGCTAQITQYKPANNGRYNITVIGHERFRITSLDQQHAYLTGTVEMYPLTSTAQDDAALARKRLAPLVKRYLHLLQEAGKVQFESNQLPRDPMTLAYLASVVIQADPAEKQNLLDTDHTTTLLNKLHDLYRHEITILDYMLSPPEDDENMGPFSLN